MSIRLDQIQPFHIYTFEMEGWSSMVYQLLEWKDKWWRVISQTGDAFFGHFKNGHDTTTFMHLSSATRKQNRKLLGSIRINGVLEQTLVVLFPVLSTLLNEFLYKWMIFLANRVTCGFLFLV
ncbi:hypothetical protein M9H77_06737 [Catharanthus roseus]|uniref:Uncharacterized protein n=1 Tax=Catharanthus roseus TaxID=4058 RepID=A0ACC0BSY3_CATRO|nr:hypothetical protein M9H77_06737 [Catharanthus roseus]